MEGTLDTEKEEVMAKGETISKMSLGSMVRRKLSDITNTQQRSRSATKEDKFKHGSSASKDNVDQILKENTTLLRLLADRNKMIEMRGLELHKLRLNLQLVHQQNRQLAQANSQMLAELNLGKDRLKTLQHELGCTLAMLKAKNLEGEEKANTGCPKISNKEKTIKCEEVAEATHGANSHKPSNPIRRRQSRNSCPGPSSATQNAASKEKADSKRICLRRHSGTFKSEQPKPNEDLFEIEDAKFPVNSLLDDPMHEDAVKSDAVAQPEVEKEDISTSQHETPQLRRSSIGRPLRKAAVKVSSYKEVPVNVKMRRSD